jgi:6,7-dimethyl-8-ribityllumazine synthase
MEERIRIGIVVGDFHRELAEVMVASARAEAERQGVDVVGVTRVPGCYEVPLVADALLERSSVQALVVLGYIEKGETLHGEVMGHAVHHALVQIQLKHRKPIGIGIIGPGATREQAETRKESYAAAAVVAALRSLEALGWPRSSRP